MGNASNRFQDLVNASPCAAEKPEPAERIDCECIHCGAPGVDLCCADCFRSGQ